MRIEAMENRFADRADRAADPSDIADRKGEICSPVHVVDE